MYTCTLISLNIYQNNNAIDVRPRESTRGNDEKERIKREAQAWGIGVTSDIFPNPGNRKENERRISAAIDLLKAQKIDIHSPPYSVIIQEIRLFSKNIFDTNGNYKPDAKERIEQLRIAIGIEGGNSTNEIAQKQKDAQDFMREYTLEGFTTKVFDLAVQHPFITKNWVVLNDFKLLKRRVTELGGLIPREYGYILASAENLMESPEFKRNTGDIETFMRSQLGQSKTIKEFQEDMQAFLRMAAREKRILTIADFSRQFDEDRPLTQQEQIVADNYIEGLKKDLAKYEGKDAKIKRISQYFKETEKNPNNLPKNIITAITKRLQVAQAMASQGNDGSMWGKAKDSLNGKDTEREALQKEIDKLTKATGKLHFPAFSKEKGGYYIASIEDLRKGMEGDIANELNVAAFTGLLSMDGWEKILIRSFGHKAIASVGAYIKSKPSTRLFQGEKAKAKDFFLQEYDKMVVAQNGLLEGGEKTLLGDFSLLFPSLKENKRITPEVEKLILSKKIGEAYDMLAATGATNGDIRMIMEAVEKDARKIKEDGQEANTKWAKVFGTKKVSDLKDQFFPKQKEDIQAFDRLTDRVFWGGQLNDNEKALLLKLAKPGSEVEKALRSTTNALAAASIQGQSKKLKDHTSKSPRTAKAAKLDDTTKRASRAAGNAVESHTELGITLTQAGENTEGMPKSDNLKLRKLKELSLRDPKTFTENERGLYYALQNWYKGYTKSASAMNTYVQLTSREEASLLVQETFGSNISQKDALRYVETQIFINSYVSEKNFTDLIETRAAYMHSGESRQIGELYNENGQVDIAKMTTSTASISLAETAFSEGELSGISELMECRVAMGSDGNQLSRTIVDKEGNVIVSNISVSALDTTIAQLGRFYATGLKILTPKMAEINTIISRVRPDSIGGTNGTFALEEDKRFLTIMASAIYGEDALPEERSLPKLIALFQSTQVALKPIYKMREHGILDSGGRINMSNLRRRLENASKTVA